MEPGPEVAPAASRPGRLTPLRAVGRTWFWLMFGLGVVVVGAYAALCFRAGDKLPAGASVAGVPIGGLHTAAAEQRLRATLGARAAEPLVVTGAGRTVRLTPAQTGMTLDVGASVRAAGGGSSFWPGRILRYYRGGSDQDAVTKVDPARHAAAVRTVVTAVQKKVVQGGLGFVRGVPIPVTAVAGRSVTEGDAADTLRHAFVRAAPGTVRFTVVEPTVTNAGVRRAMREFAKPATAAPVRLRLAKQLVVAPPRLFTQAITMVPDGDGLKPALDVDGLVAALEPVSATVAGAPRAASFVVENGKPVVVPSKKGLSFDRGALRSTFLDAVVRRPGKRTVTVPGVTAPPTFTTRVARSLGITQEIAAFTTPYGYADYRNTNIARAVDLIDGTVIRPGRTFSLADVVGEPTEQNGFVTGFEIQGGVFKPDPGAGLSQVASTLYDAVFAAGLKDAGHRVTSVYSERYPLGREASFDFGKTDLRFTDDTRHGVLVTASATPASPTGDGTLTIRLYSTRTWDVTVRTSKRYAVRPAKVINKVTAGCSAVSGTPGFRVDLTRVFRKPGSSAIDHRDKSTTVYPSANSVVCNAP